MKIALYSAPQVNVRVLMQIVACTNLRAEWLLLGTGPMFAGRAGAPRETPGALDLPPLFKTRYPVFDTFCVGVPPAFTTVLAPPSDSVAELSPGATAEHFSAAQVIHAARVRQKPVVFFLGAPALAAGAGIVTGELLARQYVTGVATTGQGLVRDIHAANITSPPDLNYIARLAANQGLGYGEALGRWGFERRDVKKRSVVHAAYTLGVPATAHIEIGEIDQHAVTTIRGAELGAAIGAASYVDFLVFTAQIRQVLVSDDSGGGVFVIAGETERGLNLFWRAFHAVTATGVTPGAFTVILIGNATPAFLQEQIQSHGGQYHTLQGNYRANVCHLFDACTAVYSGRIPHGIKQRLSVEPRMEADPTAQQ